MSHIATLDLFSYRAALPAPSHRINDWDTSIDAAKSAEINCSENQLIALRLIKEKPMTDYDLADATGMQQNSIGKRRCDLFKAGFVEPETSATGKCFNSMVIQIQGAAPRNSGSCTIHTSSVACIECLLFMVCCLFTVT